jgi:hypothetical protein
MLLHHCPQEFEYWLKRNPKILDTLLSFKTKKEECTLGSLIMSPSEQNFQSSMRPHPVSAPPPPAFGTKLFQVGSEGSLVSQQATSASNLQSVAIGTELQREPPSEFESAHGQEVGVAGDEVDGDMLDAETAGPEAEKVSSVALTMEGEESSVVLRIEEDGEEDSSVALTMEGVNETTSLTMKEGGGEPSIVLPMEENGLTAEGKEADGMRLAYQDSSPQASDDAGFVNSAVEGLVGDVMGGSHGDGGSGGDIDNLGKGGAGGETSSLGGGGADSHSLGDSNSFGGGRGGSGGDANSLGLPDLVAGGGASIMTSASDLSINISAVPRLDALPGPASPVLPIQEEVVMGGTQLGGEADDPNVEGGREEIGEEVMAETTPTVHLTETSPLTGDAGMSLQS